MTKIEALELELAARKMVEGTGLGWVEVLRHKVDNMELFSFEHIEPSLGIIEGRPVWEGDEYYDTSNNKIIAHGGLPQDYWNRCSWNPPKPKTVMVELTLEDVKYYANEVDIDIQKIIAMIDRRKEACRKALEELK